MIIYDISFENMGDVLWHESASFNIYVAQWIFTEAKCIPTNGKDLFRDKKH